jgi:hypothetical protein
VHTLRFIRRARELGFSMAEIADLLKLWQNRRRASADVKRIAQVHVADLDRRIAEMTSMRRTLETLMHCCQGNGRPECPILDELAEPDLPPQPSVTRGKKPPPSDPARRPPSRRGPAVPRSSSP